MGQGASRNDNQQPSPGVGGMYFGERFTLAAEEFPSVGEDAFLFGEMSDLSLLSRVRGTVPRVSTDVKHTNTLRALVNVQRDSINLTRHYNGETALDEYHVSFVLDADCPCEVTIGYFVEELVSNNNDISYKHYKGGYKTYQSNTIEEGFNIVFSEPMFVVKGLSQESDFEHHVIGQSMHFPLVIQVTALAAKAKHSQVTYCSFTKSGESFGLQFIAQKLNIDGVSYLMREIYGLDKHEITHSDGDDDSDMDEEGECVVCLCNPIDSLVLPCRHMCLCGTCAGSLRDQSTNCPICRKPFYAILQIQVAQKATEEEIAKHEVQLKMLEEGGGKGEEDPNTMHADEDDEELTFIDGMDGYRAIPLAEALLKHHRPNEKEEEDTENIPLNGNDNSSNALLETNSNTNSTTSTLDVKKEDGEEEDEDEEEEEEEKKKEKKKPDSVVVNMEEEEIDMDDILAYKPQITNADLVIDFSSLSKEDSDEDE
eukprot:m.94454 g.94454  ORF g.94454 m.94454 type:complete len:483 (-) comp8922_c0_seq22:3438-4886(-)